MATKIPQRSSFLRVAWQGHGLRLRLTRRSRAAAIAVGFSAALLGHVLANTEFDVPDSGTTDLSTLMPAPTATSDLTFLAAGYTQTNTNFTAGNALTIGTLNTLDTNDLLSLSGATITLSGGTNSVAPNNGGAAGDLIYAATGSSLSVSNAVTLATTVTTGNFDVAGTVVMTSALTGGGSGAVLTKTGAGTLEFDSNANTFKASNLQINAGTIDLTARGGALGDLQGVSTITVASGGTLMFSNIDLAGNTPNDALGYTPGTGALVINGGSVLNNSTSARLTIGNTVMMVGGVLGGTSPGDGGGGAYSFNVTNGGITATSDASGNAAVLSAATAPQLDTTLNVTRGSAAPGADLVVTGVIASFSSGPARAIIKTGNGVLEYDAANTYSGVTNLNAGTLMLGGATSTAGSLQNSILNLNGGTLAFGAALTATAVGGLQGSTNIALANNASTPAAVALTVGGAGSSTYSGVLSGAGSLIRSGTGTLTLSGANTFAGAATVTAGTLDLTNPLALQNATLTPNGGTVAFDSAVTGNAFTVGGVAGTGALVLANNASTPAAVALTVSGAGSSTYSGVLSGAGSLIRSGTGTLAILGTANTYSGGTTISGGTVAVNTVASGGNAALGTGQVTITTGGTLAFLPTSGTGNTQYLANSFTLSGGTIFSRDGTTHLGSSAAATPTGTISTGTLGGEFMTEYYDKPLFVDGVLTGTGPLTIDNVNNPYGAGSTHFTNAANTYSGTVTLNAPTTATAGGVTTTTLTGGSISIDAPTALQNATLNVLAGTAHTLTYNGGTGGAIISGLTGVAGGTLNLAAGPLSVGNNNTSSTFAGTLTGAGSLNKIGTGTLSLTAQNTFTGAVTVTGGILDAHAARALAGTSGITVTSGTLSISASGSLVTPGATTSTTVGSPVPVAGQVAVTLGGGTLLRNGAGVSLGTQSGTAGTVGMGMLSVTAASTLDFGTAGVGTLNINTFVDTNNSLLTISNYARNMSLTRAGVDGTDDRLIFNQSLTAAQLADISFSGFGSSAAQEIALGNGEYEITPLTTVPEPSTWVTTLLCVCAGRGLMRARRVTPGDEPFPATDPNLKSVGERFSRSAA